ncbi:hypothetical protein E2C01_094546 [Portunus trituberculatus]|uniref:Uncharacterized protein n=1 Tax=Portunus trituberculatus TaxID=210409 RepID=A0A5B7JQQ6_PORTR|nr:hypothetical protein [Portunus trituberculatus]
MSHSYHVNLPHKTAETLQTLASVRVAGCRQCLLLRSVACPQALAGAAPVCCSVSPFQSFCSGGLVLVLHWLQACWHAEAYMTRDV